MMMGLMASCKTSTSSDSDMKSLTITSVAYYATTCPSDYWQSSVTYKANLVYYFGIHFAGDIQASDVLYARIYLPNNSSSYWTLDLAKGFDAADSEIWGANCYDGDDIKALPIGTMKAEIKLTDGAVADYSFTMGVPGSKTANGYSYAYSKDDEPSPFYASSTPAIQRPTVNSLTLSGGSTLSISFTVNGDNVHNGWIWLYDSSDTYLGRFSYFLDPANGAVSPRLSGGLFNYSNGGTNTVTLSVADLVDSSGNAMSAAAFSTIAHCRVVVCDGAQYAAPGRYASFDYRALSAYR